MSRLILILVIIILALSFLRNVIRKFLSHTSNHPEVNTPGKKKNPKNENGKITDAKFEEIK